MVEDTQNDEGSWLLNTDSLGVVIRGFDCIAN